MLDRLYCWIAWYLPKGLVKWAFIRLAVNGVSKEYSNQVMSDLTCLQALQRWR